MRYAALFARWARYNTPEKRAKAYANDAEFKAYTEKRLGTISPDARTQARALIKCGEFFDVARKAVSQ